MGNYKFDINFDDKICTKIVESGAPEQDMRLLLGHKNHTTFKEELGGKGIFLHYVFHKFGNKKGEMSLGISSDPDEMNGYDQSIIRENALPAFMKERYIRIKKCYKKLNLPEEIKKYLVVRPVIHGTAHHKNNYGSYPSPNRLAIQ
jgi:hypothetical protein